MKKHVGKEVFIMVDESNARNSTTVYENADEVLTSFRNRLATNIADVTLYHGVLTKAGSIPDDEISSNIDIVILIPIKGMCCHIVSCFSLEYAQKVMPALVGVKPSTSDTDFTSIMEDIKGVPKQDIDNIFILYGYTVELHYTFDKTELDEEILTGSKEIYASIAANQ